MRDSTGEVWECERAYQVIAFATPGFIMGVYWYAVNKTKRQYSCLGKIDSIGDVFAVMKKGEWSISDDMALVADVYEEWDEVQDEILEGNWETIDV